MIVHLTEAETWNQALQRGELIAASVHTEGFAHCSTVAQILGVANRFYRAQTGLVLLAIDETQLTAPLRWEAPAHPDGSASSPDADQFPHVYGAIDIAAVIDVVPIVASDGGEFSPDQIPRNWS